MSGVFKAIGKVFKKVGKIISKVVKGVVKAVKKVFKSKIFKAILIAAAIWFTAGTAAAYFAAPQAGLMSAMSTSAGNMWATTTSFFGGGAGAGAGVGEVGVTGAGEAAAAGAAEAGAMISPLPSTTVTAGTVGAAETAAAGLDVAATAAQPGIIGKTLGWAKANPLLASTVVKGVGSVAAGVSRRGEAEDARRAEEDRLRERGLYGQAYGGEGADLYTGGEGLIGAQMKPIQAPTVGAVQPPSVAQAPTAVAPRGVPRPVPMSRSDLLRAQNEGYILPAMRKG